MAVRILVESGTWRLVCRIITATTPFFFIFRIGECMRFSFRTKLLVSFGVFLILFSLFSWKLHQIVEDSERDAQVITHTNEVLDVLQELETTMVSIQTGERGYVITSNDDFLQPFYTGSKRINHLIDSLRQRIDDNPKQLRNLDTLISVVQSKMNFVSEVIRVVHDLGRDSSASKISTGAGKHSMERILQVTEMMKQEERQLLHRRHEFARASASTTKTMSYTTLVLVCIFSVLLFFSIQRYPAILEKTQQELAQKVSDQTSMLHTTNRELQREIDERKRTQELILASEAKYRHTLDAMMEGCQIIGYDWRYLYINEPGARQGRHSRDELIGRTMMECYPGIERTDMFKKLAHCMKERIPQYMENRFTYPDGSKGCFELKIQPVEEGIFILSVDISERKRVEDELSKNVSILLEVGKLANIGGWELDLETMDLRWTEQTYAIYEIDPSTTPRVDEALNFYPPDARPTITEAVNAGILEGRPWDLELPFITATGKHRWVRSQGKGEYCAGQCVRLFGAFQDITERKLAEEEIRKSQEQFKVISENVADMIAVLDRDGKRLYNSPSYRQILGDVELLQGTDSFEDIHPDDRENIRQIFQKTKETGIGHRAEYRLIGKNGNVHNIESQGSVARDEAGEITSIIVVSRDVTEKKKLEQQFLRMQRMESIGALAGGIAHDLNNVLAPIMLALNFIGKRIQDDHSIKMLQILEASTKRGSELIKQVLSFARGVESEFTMIQVRHLIDQIGKIITHTFPKSIVFQTKYTTDVPPVLADATQLHQVLMNLCVNARDAMPNGGKLEIEVEAMELDEQYVRMNLEAKLGNYLIITVSDQGAGIPAAILERVFEPFFTTKEIGKGTGLGLSTVIAIIKSHNGFINVYSEVGKGTTFKVYLPIREGTYVSTAEEKKAIPSSNGELILVVDDEASIREITKITLTAYGYSVLTASDGNEALSAYGNNTIDLVVTDMMMPNMDGEATIRSIQEINPYAKIIAVSGLKHDGKIINQEHVVFLHKPYTSEKLLQSIDDLLNKKRT